MAGGESIANEGHGKGGIHTAGHSANYAIRRGETSFMRALDRGVMPWCPFEDLVEMHEPDTR